MRVLRLRFRRQPVSKIDFWALNLIVELAPETIYPDLKEQIVQAKTEGPPSVQAATLPLFVHVQPEEAARELATLLDQREANISLTVSMAKAWGELAKSGNRARQGPH